MYAVFLSGGKQHKAVEGGFVKLEKINKAVGDQVEFDQVLMVAQGTDVEMGSPFIDGKKVVAEVIAHGRREKIRVIKFRRRKHHLKRMGHRQDYTQVKIVKV